MCITEVSGQIGMYCNRKKCLCKLHSKGVVTVVCVHTTVLILHTMLIANVPWASYTHYGYWTN